MEADEDQWQDEPPLPDATNIEEAQLTVNEIFKVVGKKTSLAAPKEVIDDKDKETRQEKEMRKYDISIDQFKERQWVKNPISSWILLVLSINYIAVQIVSIPLAVKAVSGCSLSFNYQNHLIFFFISVVFILPSDAYAYLHSARITEILAAQNLLVNLDPKTQNFFMLMGHFIGHLLNIVCTVSTIFELYSDVLILTLAV